FRDIPDMDDDGEPSVRNHVPTIRLRAGHSVRQPFPHRRAARPRRYGRGLSRGRSEARPAGRAEAAAVRAAIADRDVLHVPRDGHLSTPDRFLPAVRGSVDAAAAGIAAVLAFGFYASRGSEPLFGRTILE